MGETRNTYRLLVWKPEEKRKLGRPRHKWGDNIKMPLKLSKGIYGLNSFGWEWEPTSCFCRHDNESSGSILCGEFLTQLSNC
jgi:hypothetical protein